MSVREWQDARLRGLRPDTDLRQFRQNGPDRRYSCIRPGIDLGRFLYSKGIYRILNA